MRGWLFGAVLAACYAPSPPAGVPCIPGEERCPDGQVCAAVGGAFQCSAPTDDDDPDAAPPVDVDPNADDDHDGTRNTDDNCPAVANTDQANEDADPFGDACDPCPPFADAAPLDDPDGDLVSGACDPFPQLAGDRIAVFESFNTSMPPPGWTTIGDWTFANGQAVIVSGSGEVNYLTIVQPMKSREAVFAKLSPDELLGSGARAVGPAQMFQPSPLRSITCTLLRDGNGPEIAIDDTGGPRLDRGPSTFDAGQTSILRAVRQDETYTCNDGTSTISGTSNYSTATPATGVRTKSVSAHFDWVLIVAGP